MIQVKDRPSTDANDDDNDDNDDDNDDVHFHLKYCSFPREFCA